MKKDHNSSYPARQPSVLTFYRWILGIIDRRLRIETDPEQRERLERDRANCLQIINLLKEENENNE